MLKIYQNKWVALTPNYEKVVSSGKKLDEVLSKLKRGRKNNVVFLKVTPPSYAPVIL